MILLIKSCKHYSLISSSGAAAGGWELLAAVTEVVLVGVGHRCGKSEMAGWCSKAGTWVHFFIPPLFVPLLSLPVCWKDNAHQLLEGNFRENTPLPLKAQAINFPYCSLSFVIVFHLPLSHLSSDHSSTVYTVDL